MSAQHVPTQLGSLQPTLAPEFAPEQIAGLVVLALLLNPHVLVHDTQLLDHPYITDSYRHIDDWGQGRLYQLVRGGVRAGLIQVAVRDRMVIAPDGREADCGSLAAVHEGWMRQALPGVVFVNGENTRSRLVLNIARDLDRALSSPDAVVREYTYREVKVEFQRRVRALFSADLEGSPSVLRTLDPSTRQKYAEILDREWFSHSDLYLLLRDNAAAQAVVPAQGLIDEASFATWFHSDLAGVDSERDPGGHQALLRASSRHEHGQKPSNFEAFLSDQRRSMIRGPGVSLLSRLTLDDILELREKAPNFFLVRSLEMDPTKAAKVDPIAAYREYWQEITDHIARRYPAVARRPTRIIVALEDHVPPIASIVRFGVRIALSIVEDATSHLPVVRSLPHVSEAITRRVGLEFLVLADTEELRELRKTIPRSSWRIPIDLRTSEEN